MTVLKKIIGPNYLIKSAIYIAYFVQVAHHDKNYDRSHHVADDDH